MYAKVTKVTPRKTKVEKQAERLVDKEYLSRHLEYGDIMEIRNQINMAAAEDKTGTLKRISYNMVQGTLSPKSKIWSPRTMEFAKVYVAAKIEAKKDSSNGPETGYQCHSTTSGSNKEIDAAH